MEGVLRAATRRFVSSGHIRNVMTGSWVPMFDEEGRELDGIRGRMGVAATTQDGVSIGIDLMEMSPGAAFPLHVHDGDHLLYVVSGRGLVHVGGVDHPVEDGDTVHIPALLPHGVKTDPSSDSKLVLLAVGHPHKPLSALDRMRTVSDDD